MECPKCQAKIGEDSHFCSKCGSQVRAANGASVSLTITLQTPSKGVRIGSTFAERYRIVDEIGRGGMGIVYKAEDLRLERNVALKFLPPELTQDEEAKERFVLEARAAAAVTHPNICTIHEIDEFEGQTFIAMEFIEGQSLREKVKEAPIAVDETLDIAIQVASGLEEAHKKGIIHRDIKSANIMVTPAGQAKIMDFGLAKVTGSALITQEGVTLGTVAYMSPEQARGDKVDRNTDIWSLGIVLYEMLSGQLPFWGDKEASVLYSIEHKEHKPIRAFNPNIPPEFEAIINRCLQKKPEARFKSAKDIVTDLRKYQDSLRAEEAGFFNLKSLLRRLRQPKYAIPLLVVIAATAFLLVQYFNRQAKIRWAREELLPEVGRLVEKSQATNTIESYKLAVEAEKFIPNDPVLQEYIEQSSLHISIQTTPPGATVYMKKYTSPESEWTRVGVSPLENMRVPLGYLRWKLEKEGYETVIAASSTFQYDPEKDEFLPMDLARTFDKVDSIPSGMVRVAGDDDLEDFFIDKYEVTNKKYKEFVESGGYQKKEYWKHPFIKDDETLTWEEAVQEFVDTTGRPGPSTWQGGNYPEGQDDHPVSGVSWYEAVAYAEYTSKSLPSDYHWMKATGYLFPKVGWGLLSVITPLSTYGGKGPGPVGSNPGISFFGVYDMAGNVREWCWNESNIGRCIRGGAWDDATYMALRVTHLSAFNRSSKNGFRCALYLDKDKIPDWALESRRSITRPDLTKIKPVTDEVFSSYKDLFSYDPSDLNAKVEKRNETSNYWSMEKVTFDAAYGDERVIAFLFLPKNVSPPYQTVIYFPGTGEFLKTSSDEISTGTQFKNMLEFIVKDGRAVMYPVYKGTFERGDPEIYSELIYNIETFQGTQLWIQLIKDVRRSLDYLETRPDIQREKLVLYVYSVGGLIGTIVPAIEDRLAANILCLSGLSHKGRAEIKPINYVRRVKIPTLLISGKQDHVIIDFETRAKPLFELLGTPENQKHHRICDTDHFVQKNVVIRDVLWFLDKYLGPAKSAKID